MHLLSHPVDRLVLVLESAARVGGGAVEGLNGGCGTGVLLLHAREQLEQVAGALHGRRWRDRGRESRTAVMKVPNAWCRLKESGRRLDEIFRMKGQAGRGVLVLVCVFCSHLLAQPRGIRLCVRLALFVAWCALGGENGRLDGRWGRERPRRVAAPASADRPVTDCLGSASSRLLGCRPPPPRKRKVVAPPRDARAHARRRVRPPRLAAPLGAA